MLSSIALLVALAGVSVFRPTASHEQTIDVREVVRQVKATYAATHGARVRFEQKGDGLTVSGTLSYSAGDRYRLDLPKQTIVCDGTRTWTYVPERNQVVIGRALQAKNRLTPASILTSFPGDYLTTLGGSSTVNGRSVWIVQCSAAGEPSVGDVTRATLFVDKATWRFQRVDVESPSVGSVQIRVISADYSPKFAGDTFSFTPPSGARVIDLTR